MAIFDRARSGWRWGILPLACVAMIGSYYSFDIPSALQDTLKADNGGLHLSSFNFNLLYSVYSFPNVILPLFGGFFVDKIGVTICLVVFSGLIMIGQAVVSLGVSLGSFYLVLAGRVIFGFGGESLGVAQSSLLAMWFKGKETAFAMGLQLSIARMGSVINDWVSPEINDRFSTSYAFWFGACICALSFVSSIFIGIVERWAGNQVKEGENDEALLGKEPDKKEEIRLSDVRFFTLCFWLVTVSCVTIYSAILPFNNIAEDFLETRYGYSQHDADRILGIPYFISAVITPFLGSAVDRWGHRATLMYVAGGAVALVHMSFAFTSIPAYPPLIVLGVAYSVYAAVIWPSVALVVDEHMIGTAYGVVTAVQNMGLAFVPMIVGTLQSSYTNVETFFMCMGCLGVLVSIWLNYLDKQTGSRLNKPHSALKAIEPTIEDGTITTEKPAEKPSESVSSEGSVNPAA